MFKALSYLLLGAACALAGCQSSPKASDALGGPGETAQPAPAATTAATSAAAPTEAAARAAVRSYLQAQPDAALFVVDSARVNDNEATWQVLVPRTDWAKRMPNAARFEVDKATGAVSTGAVK